MNMKILTLLLASLLPQGCKTDGSRPPIMGEPEDQGAKAANTNAIVERTADQEAYQAIDFQEDYSEDLILIEEAELGLMLGMSQASSPQSKIRPELLKKELPPSISDRRKRKFEQEEEISPNVTVRKKAIINNQNDDFLNYVLEVVDKERLLTVTSKSEIMQVAPVLIAAHAAQMYLDPSALGIKIKYQSNRDDSLLKVELKKQGFAFTEETEEPSVTAQGANTIAWKKLTLSSPIAVQLKRAVLEAGGILTYPFPASLLFSDHLTVMEEYSLTQTLHRVLSDPKVTKIKMTRVNPTLTKLMTDEDSFNFAGFADFGITALKEGDTIIFTRRKGFQSLIKN